VGAEATGAGTAEAEMLGAADGVFATGGAKCFRAKKKVAATRIIAAAEMKMSVVAVARVGCFAWDDGDVTSGVGALGSAAGTAAACGGGGCGSGEVVGTLSGGRMPGGILLGAATLGATLFGVLGGTVLGGTLPGGTIAVGMFPVGIGLGGA
jgi:hypothetical protein